MDPKRTGRFIQAVDFPARKPKPVMQNFLAVHEMSAEIPIWKCFKRRHFRRKFFKRFVGPINKSRGLVHFFALEACKMRPICFHTIQPPTFYKPQRFQAFME